MIVQCPNCNTKYNFDDSSLSDSVKVRCTRCKHVFKVSPLDDKDDSQFQDTDADFSLGTKKSRKKKEAEETPQWDPNDLNVDLVPPVNKKLERRKAIRSGLISLAVIALIGLGLYYVLPRMDNSLSISFLDSQPPKEEETDKEFTEEDVKDISLDNIRQYFVSNDKIGQLFVIEGQAVNNFDVPKSMIKLRATLYNAQGNQEVSKDFLCGNVASLFQLQVSSQEELESTLQARLGILTTNKFIEPGGYTPFMVVFYNPPEEVQEFGLEVIEAHDPAP
ncbi:DUF3426 domain-containing protein [Desulfonatronovibrio hydrogenovorans]|uniref:DUF3426 domain-containing protein n=1 Tax=Desulfonatronovibrio hydrogenovorans TaxID=53245 RepID=UPI0004905E09|nr:DUF3426 domain-containing protein [Desulfonatronovibrio hydrogenovorans]